MAGVDAAASINRRNSGQRGEGSGAEAMSKMELAVMAIKRANLTGRDIEIASSKDRWLAYLEHHGGPRELGERRCGGIAATTPNRPTLQAVHRSNSIRATRRMNAATDSIVAG